MAIDIHSIKLSDYDISEKRGFLPEEDPVISIYPYCVGNKNAAFLLRWERTAKQLPKLLTMGKARQVIDNEAHYFYQNVFSLTSKFDIRSFLKDKMAQECVMRTFSYLGHAYILEGSEWITTGENIVDRLNPYLALLWYQTAKALERPPVLSYASYALHNWYRLDKTKPIELGNIALIQNFLGGLDEEWFILIHVVIEAKMAPIPYAILEIMRALGRDDHDAIVKNLEIIARSLEDMCVTAERMWERCDSSFVYYNRVRPYIIGWKNNAALPKGVLYPGVEEYQEEYQQFRGETGAQSSLIPLLDAFFGVEHQMNELTQFLADMLNYMPKKHRDFIKTVALLEKNGYSISSYLMTYGKLYPRTIEFAVKIGKLIDRFLTEHLRFEYEYIRKHKQKSPANPTTVGTGGTPHEKYLKQHREDRRKHFVKLEQV